MGALKLKIKGLNGLMVSEINKDIGATNEENSQSDNEANNVSIREKSPLKPIEPSETIPQNKEKSPEKSIEPIKINTLRGEKSIIKPIEPIKITQQKLVKLNVKSTSNFEKTIEPLKIKTPPATNGAKVRKSVIVSTRGRGRPRKGLVPKLKIISPTVPTNITTSTINNDNQNVDSNDINSTSDVCSNSAPGPANIVWSICDATDPKAESSEIPTKVYK